MNSRESMRWVGILLGVAGGIIGGVLAYGQAQTVWGNRSSYRRFESVMATPTMQKVAKAARDHQNSPSGKQRPDELGGRVAYYDAKQGTISDNSPTDSSAVPGEVLPARITMSELPGRKAILAYTLGDAARRAGAIQLIVDLDEIKEVAADRAGLISSVHLSAGEWVWRVESPRLSAYLLLLLYPVLGFLIPRILTSAGAGLVAPPRHTIPRRNRD